MRAAELRHALAIAALHKQRDTGSCGGFFLHRPAAGGCPATIPALTIALGLLGSCSSTCKSKESNVQRAFLSPPPPHPTQQRFLCSLAMQCLPLQCCEPGRTELGCTGLCSVPTAALQPGGGGGRMTAHSPHSAPEGKTARAPEKCLQPYKLTPLFIIFLSAVA